MADAMMKGHALQLCPCCCTETRQDRSLKFQLCDVLQKRGYFVVHFAAARAQNILSCKRDSCGHARCAGAPDPDAWHLHASRRGARRDTAIPELH